MNWKWFLAGMLGYWLFSLTIFNISYQWYKGKNRANRDK